jgi:hypothetical protein
MSVEGRVSVDVLFHDKDGTNAVNVASLAASKGYTGGKVAIVNGTVGTATVTLFPSSGVQYRDAAGNLVALGSVSVFALYGTDVIAEAFGNTGEDDSVFASIYSSGDVVSMTQPPYDASEVRLRSPNGTSSYTLILYGT